MRRPTPGNVSRKAQRERLARADLFFGEKCQRRQRRDPSIAFLLWWILLGLLISNTVGVPEICRVGVAMMRSGVVANIGFRQLARVATACQKQCPEHQLKKVGVPDTPP